MQRRNASDFATHFGRGFEREAASQQHGGSSDSGGTITLVNQIVINDRVVQETINTINRLEQSGRGAIKR